jgi:hypothetical protein
MANAFRPGVWLVARAALFVWLDIFSVFSIAFSTPRIKVIQVLNYPGGVWAISGVNHECSGEHLSAAIFFFENPLPGSDSKSD